MKLETWVALNVQAKRVEILERNLNALKNAMRPLDEYGIPQKPLKDSARSLYLAKERERAKLSRIPRDAGDPIYEWVKETHGVGDALFFLLGMIPPLAPTPPAYPGFPCPAAVHRYVGLHAPNGKAVKREAGKFLGFAIRLRAYATVRLIDPIIKTGGPFREVYDARKLHTLETHPPMVEEGGGCDICDEAYGKTRTKREGSQQTRERTTVAFDCANLGGIHWTDGHRHRDAIRKTAKMLLADTWAVENGRQPRVAQNRNETSSPFAAVGV